jgi:4-diphosphocytidyl-2-C-methyl-D-erythritol kinase
MLFFPNCKINLGLHVVSKRNDGFHDIETVFYPIGWQDGLEVIENKNGREPIILTYSGNAIHGDTKDNLVYKVWELITAFKKIPPVKVHLYKNIPMGAGLGGGSSDAAFFINLLDKKFNLGIPNGQKTEIASKIGSDCPFFIENKPVLAKGRGNIFYEIKTDLQKYYFLVVHPGIHCNTKEAYQGLAPQKPANDLKSVIEKQPLKEWKNLLVNDFENYVFKMHPEIKELKHLLYDSGAVYASLSGSGSAVFGIFEEKPDVSFNTSFNYFLQKPVSKLSFC